MRPSIRAIVLAALLLSAYRANAHDVTIANAPSSGGAWNANTWTPNADGATLSATEIAQHLGSAPVTVVSTDGDALTVRATLNWSARTLTLSAGGDLDIESSLGASGAAGLVLEYGQSTVAAGNTARYRVAAPVNLAATASFATRQGSDGPATSYTILTSLGAQGSTTGTDLQGMQGNLVANYALGADIDASATSGWSGGFTPIGYGTLGASNVVTGPAFTGRFDGLGHSIGNLAISRSTQDLVGLFGYASGASFSNVALANANVAGRSEVGVLLGRGNNVTVQNVATAGQAQASGVASGTAGTGGVAGFVHGGTLSDVHASVAVAGTYWVGGAVGRLETDSGVYALVTGSSASGNVTATGASSLGAGGLVGVLRNYCVITKSHASGTVSASKQVGGLVGYIYSTGTTDEWNNHTPPVVIDTTYATGDVTGIGNYVGGLIGDMDGFMTIANSYATGNVSGTNGVGGLVGFSTADNTSKVNASILRGVYARDGSVTGNINVGGLIGTTSGFTNIRNSYAANGPLTVTTVGANVGGLVGWVSSSYTLDWRGPAVSTVWNTQTSGVDDPYGGGLLTDLEASFAATTAQMMTLYPYLQATFNYSYFYPESELDTLRTYVDAADHPFVEGVYDRNTLYLYEGQTYPLLRAFLTPVTISADLSAANRPYNGQIASGAVGSYNTSVPVDPGQILGTLTYATSSANAGIYRASDGTLDVGGSLYSSQLGYEIVYSPDTSLTIAKAPLTLSTSDVTKVYDGTISANGTAVVVGGQLFSNDSISGGHFAFVDKNAGTNKAVTVDGVTVSDGNGGNNYAVSYANNTHSTITKAPASIVANSNSVIYNGHAQSVTGYSVSGLVNNEPPDVLTGLSESGGSGTDVGNYPHTVSGTDGNYALTFTAGALAITPRAQVLTFPPQYAPIRYFTPGATFPIGPLASSDAAPYTTSPITYSSLSGGMCSVSGTTVTMLAIGTCTIAADQAADANHTAAAQVTQAVELSGDAPPLVLWIDGSDFVRYGQHADYTVTLTASGSAANAAVVTFALSGDVDAATASLVCEGGGNGASCEQDASDPLRFTVTLPASRTLTWHVSLPVRSDATGDTIGLSASSDAATPVAATTTLVIFRDGFDVQL